MLSVLLRTRICCPGTARCAGSHRRVSSGSLRGPVAAGCHHFGRPQYQGRVCCQMLSGFQGIRDPRWTSTTCWWLLKAGFNVTGWVKQTQGELQRQALKLAKGFVCKNMISQFQGRAARGGRCHARMQLLVVQAAFGKQENSFQSEGLPVYL